jgi:hypothetical protein
VIARVAVGASAVESLSATGTRAEVFARHASICEALEAHGYLVIGNNDEGRELVRAIRASGSEAAQVWAQLVTRFKRVGRLKNIDPPCPAGLDELTEIEQLRSGWATDTDLAVFPDDRATLFGVPENELSQLDAPSGIEIARAAAASFAPPISRFKASRDAGVLECGATRERLWDEVLMPIARISRSLIVVDRYLFTNLGNRVAGGQGADSFIAWLLERLDRDAQAGCTAVLVGYDERPDGGVRDAEAAAQLVRAVYAAGGDRLAGVDVVTTQPAGYLPHDRHISASVGVGVSFASGFGALDRTTISALEGVEWAYRFHPDAVQKLQTAEQRFLSDRSAQRAIAYVR